MSAVLASGPWHDLPTDGRAARWRFAVAREGGWWFELKRNVALSPRQLGMAYGLLCAVALLVAAVFWLQGARIVMLFTGVELLAVGTALLVAARHMGDRDIVQVCGRDMRVVQHVGSVVQRAMFSLDWVRVEPAGREGSLVELSGGGRRVRIGRHVRPELRGELARELRRVIQLARAAAPLVRSTAPSAEAEPRDCEGTDGAAVPRATSTRETP